jgi:glycosyltransferase involved in cell wall biosynthesis
LNHAPRISVVIPTLGRETTLPRVLEALDRQTASADAFEVILVADATVADLASLDRLTIGRSYTARRLQGAVPGASAARNAGWRAAEALLILFIDDDILPSPQLLEQHLAWHGRHPGEQIGVLGHVSWAAELRITPFLRWLEHGIQFNYPSIRGEEAGWGNFYTANASVKRVLVEQAGGFDEQRLPFGYEDLDLALRMHEQAGFRLLYNRAAGAEHLHEMDLEFWRHRVRRIALSERRFVALHPDFPPYFHDLLSDAAARPPVGSWTERLAARVPRRLPLVGPLVWSRADLYYRQALAGSFLDAWSSEDQPSLEPSASASSGGSSPEGPK